MWFIDAPEPTDGYGSESGPNIRFVTAPDDGLHIWALVRMSLARQQVADDHEFEIMPDALLQTAAGWIGGSALGGTPIGRALPDSLVAVMGHGPDALNLRVVPMSPALLVVDGDNIMAVRRTFEGIDVYTALVDERWLAAWCPSGTRPVLSSEIPAGRTGG